FSLAQLYSTASYKAHDLTGVHFAGTFKGADLSGQNLAHASFYDTDFSNANLSHAILTESADGNFQGGNLTGADARNAFSLNTTRAIIKNFIQPDGHISGLSLGAGEWLDINDYHPSADYLSRVSITVDQAFAMSAGSELKFKFSSLDWGSTISFAKTIP